ncbi:MAG TPA: Gfo/Idh/MocA family oxidoreductase [Verrucomicrobiae bacterium]|nr:Gfo/Idh/MocA family oxidoreductase [Verrucomicrobiae bacterium]
MTKHRDPATKSKPTFSRRGFLRTAALGGTGLLILPNSRSAFAYDANSKLNVAAIGVGGRGRDDISGVAALGENIVALCDVDQDRATDSFKKYPGAKTFTDFRRMFDEMGRGIDAVIVATPDHCHAVAAAAAIQRGQHVYCEKPLTHTVHEARMLRLLARKHGVVTQMGNQGSSSDSVRRAVELAWSGTIGEIREAYVWFPSGNGPMTRPADRPPVPATLDWDLWLGPTEWRPYSNVYCPEKWRSWRAFGSGVIGDMGCHTSNIMFRALKLEQLWNPPNDAAAKRIIIRIETLPSERDAEGFPRSMQALIDLPARGDMPPVQLTVQTSNLPSPDLMLGYTQDKWGDLIVGSKGSIYSRDPWNTNFVLLPEDKFKDVKHGPPQTIPPSTDHYREWTEACKGHGETFSSFEIGGPMTELMQLINLATMFEEALEYDTISGRILNSHHANEMLQSKHRRGWSI